MTLEQQRAERALEEMFLELLDDVEAGEIPAPADLPEPPDGPGPRWR